VKNAESTARNGFHPQDRKHIAASLLNPNLAALLNLSSAFLCNPSAAASLRRIASISIRAVAAPFFDLFWSACNSSRYETTLDRLLKSLYDEFLTLEAHRVNNLLAARKELKKKSEIISEPLESTTSEPKMVRKTRLHIIQPLTKITRESLETASDWGLLNELKRTLFPERTAA
jgi:hypothetical protein